MPIGIIVNSLSVLIGGLIGVLIGKKMSDKLKVSLTLMLGVCGMALGITLIVKVQNLAPVILSIAIGTAIGELTDIEGKLQSVAVKLHSKLQKGKSAMDERAISNFLTVLILFCASCTGIFGALNESLTGDHSVLIIKAILDFCTAMIFATTVGYLIALISIPQFVIGMVLFSLASFIMPYVNDIMIADFKACGGIITFAVGFRVLELKQIRVTNALPALLVVMPLSYLWTRLF